MVNFARKLLLHDKPRFILSVLGVAFAVTLVLLQIGLFMGILDNASITIDHLDADIWITSKNTPNIDFAHTFPETYLQRVRSIPGVERADNLIVWYLLIALPSGTQETVLVYAMEDFVRWHFPWLVVEGDLSDLRRGRYFFMDDSAKSRFGPFAVGEYREIVEHRLKIVGRTREAISFTTSPVVFMDYRIAQAIDPISLSGRTTYIVVKLAPGADIAAVSAELRRRLPHNDIHSKAEWRDISRDYWVTNTGIGLNMYVSAFLGALVGVVIVAQTLYASTMAHLREFGVIKAIGGSNADCYKILAQQAVTAALLGYGSGYLLAHAMGPVVAHLDLKLMITTELSVAVFAGTLVLCLAAALFSFRSIASLDPALVFRG
ncbi:MAG: ABC transporter permease [Proteobacteria bacterium]|nr:ABC transporter permease [Pseudomonadota bacterium]